MRGQAGFFDVDERLKELSAKGDDLERPKGLIDFDLFRSDLQRAVPRADRAKGGRPPFEHVFMFKVLILQSRHSLSDERCEYLIKDRLSFMGGFSAWDLPTRFQMPKTIWTFREALTRARIDGKLVVEALFLRFDAMVKACGYLAMGGKIVDATIIAAPRQRNTKAEKQAIKEDRIPEDWKDKPAKLAQKIVMRAGRSNTPRPSLEEDGYSPVADLEVLAATSTRRLGFDRRHGLIRNWMVTDAAAHDGARLVDLLDAANTASDVWADMAYRSKRNEAHLEKHDGFKHQVQRGWLISDRRASAGVWKPRHFLGVSL